MDIEVRLLRLYMISAGMNKKAIRDEIMNTIQWYQANMSAAIATSEARAITERFGMAQTDIEEKTR